MSTTDAPVIEAIYAERLFHAKRVMLGLTEDQRIYNFSMLSSAENSEHGPVMSVAEHCGMDPWFQQRGFITTLDDDLVYMDQSNLSQPAGIFFGTSLPFYYGYYPKDARLRGMTVDDAIAALDREFQRFSRITLERFIEWLRALPAGTTFCEGLRADTCPVAKFLRRPAYNADPSLTWVGTFIARYDAYRSESLEDALQIAEELLSTAAGSNDLDEGNDEDLH